MARAKGLPKTGGRQKGTTNKLNADIKAMILGALHDAGGREYLARQAEENPAPFMALLGKILPTTLTGPNDGPIQVESLTPEQRAAEARALIDETFGAFLIHCGSVPVVYRSVNKGSAHGEG